MTDTRKDFDEFYKKEPLAGSECYDWCLQTWQACQQLNDKRIADLLAVIAKKDLALEYYANKRNWSKDSQEYGSEVSDYNVMWDDFEEINQATKQAGRHAIEALAITPESVELVEVMSNTNGSLKWTVDDWPQSCKLYTIKQKG